jgi:hypothetical protein
MTELTWIQILNHEDYEICVTYPYQIRKKSNQLILTEGETNDGYIQCTLNAKTFLKHRIIAIQFIDNPNQLLFVDHINRNRTDNHIKNLRWVSAFENQRNLVSHFGVVYSYVDKISDDAVCVDIYNGHTIENLFFYENVFYFWTGIQFRILHVIQNRSGNHFVNVMDVNRQKISMYYSKFKREYDLI